MTSKRNSTSTKLISFAGLLALVFAGAAFAGSRIDPSVEDTPGHGGEAGMTAMDSHGASTLPGLSASAGGYTLAVDRSDVPAGRPVELGFSIETSEGSIQKDFDLTHERQMHLILVRRDYQGFQHLHPDQNADGSWSVTSGSLAPGVYRMFADFSAGGESLTLATDLFVAGDFKPKPLAPVSPVADAGDGYEVEIDSPSATGGATVPAEFTVSRDGEPVDEVQPYLGADGHLVALREGDQAFLHTHPEGEPGGAGPIRFQVQYPTAGRYRLYLQFRHGGKVRTAEFTRIAGHEGGDH